MIGDFYTWKNSTKGYNALMVDIGCGYLKFYSSAVSDGRIVFEDDYVTNYWELV